MFCLALDDSRHQVVEDWWIRLLRNQVGDRNLMLYWHLVKGRYVVGVWLDRASRLISEEAVIGPSRDACDERLVDYLLWIRGDSSFAASKERSHDALYQERRYLNEQEAYEQDHADFKRHEMKRTPPRTQEEAVMWSRI